MPDRDSKTELTDDDRGRWLVTTVSGSVYAFDLDARTVERVGGGERPSAAPSDSLQSLRRIIEIRVGSRGRWWIRNTGGYTDPDEIWQWSSEAERLEPVSEVDDD